MPKEPVVEPDFVPTYYNLYDDPAFDLNASMAAAAAAASIASPISPYDIAPAPVEAKPAPTPVLTKADKSAAETKEN